MGFGVGKALEPDLKQGESIPEGAWGAGDLGANGEGVAGGHWEEAWEGHDDWLLAVLTTRGKVQAAIRSQDR